MSETFRGYEGFIQRIGWTEEAEKGHSYPAIDYWCSLVENGKDPAEAAILTSMEFEYSFDQINHMLAMTSRHRHRINKMHKRIEIKRSRKGI